MELIAKLNASDLLERGRAPIVGVDKLAEVVADADALAGGHTAAQVPQHSFPGFVLVLDRTADKLAAGTDAAVHHID